MDATSLLHVLPFVASPTDALALLTALPSASLPPPFTALLHLFQQSKHFEWPVPRVECAGNMHMDRMLAAMPILPAVKIEQPDHLDDCLQAARVVSLAVPAELTACDSDELCRLIHQCTRLNAVQVDVASAYARGLLRSIKELKVSFATVPGHYRLVERLDACKVTHLDVRGNQQEDLSPLLATVSSLPALTHLTLGYCNLNEAVAQSLAGAPVLCSARFFSVVWRTESVLRSLLAYLGRSRRLQNVAWRRCAQIARVAQAWMPPTLGCAQFLDCDLDDTFVYAIADELRARTIPTPLTILLDCHAKTLALESVAAVLHVLASTRNTSVHFEVAQGYYLPWFWDNVRLQATVARVQVKFETRHARHHCYLASPSLQTEM
ncbi:hypothetical protein SPRG_14227 [Saprolegnia parasitica CBS 223.65]|uniref:F-box domain-containing protein n=1 Tax=Saprolegnia parasitica (strain CBS 223.65) TaxID=695850 RepID=A0A067BP95_SAPPC|nr:hypothetical protein SPRG_14227 [Saprolegnia parasitica CBS 223.65]KDO20078.1 hypothetical protein SPRG_14227 [Saprolegnia parasitica CBS 223.65]|eukprot:XP_012209238.1 hypothetical protein SPRG_14227 [Saprolegnia parasitica CBS 223.65]